MGGIYKFSGNRWEYAIGPRHHWLRGWMPVFRSFVFYSYDGTGTSFIFKNRLGPWRWNYSARGWCIRGRDGWGHCCSRGGWEIQEEGE